MGNVINLRQARKRLERNHKRDQSEAATAATGVKKTDHTRAKRLNDVADRLLDGHKREDDE